MGTKNYSIFPSPNPKKTEFVAIVHPQKTRNLNVPEVIMLDGSDIKKIDQVKSLGVIIDEKLTWDEHFKHVKRQNECWPFGSKTAEKYFTTISVLQCYSCSGRESPAVWRRYFG